ncbi:serine hydrolase domain-containing protein [Petropleomorpha daqingensis]|uniref:CubicO group peptidase (Beta-lactamase class C family) n=1 Tax=Petropleomorpha daqingensis TaxID=2026353 RepID=A0A853CAT7_9ACTN|nr:serine hydrolase domain-containing protein [Petropleomorpha daqingensis]NYJ04136.1 CubicO group peptidase (beta-lactamase class C family) [Petropleomorpha daqingensis]
MTKLDEVGSWLTERLPGLIAEHDVPAAAVAVCAGGDVVEAAAGVLSRATGVEATTDSVFQIGSITKVWTATLVLQLADEGLVDLDAPVRKYLPDLRLADEDAAAALTVRQLLSHTAGFEGDIFTDTGRGDDALEKYVATLGDVQQLFPPGELFSYNNAGYCVLGRLVEVLRERPYDDCLREHLFGPLGLATASPSPYEAILHRVAVGHLQPDPDAGQVPAPVWAMARSNAPAGSMLAMSAHDLLAFARLHLDGGRAPDGTQVLASGSVAAMQQRQVRLPDLRILGDAWGLGWELYEGLGTAVVGHGGNTIGQASFLYVLPEKGVAVVLLTNGGNPYGLSDAVIGHALRELAGVELRPMPAPPADPVPVDATPFEGTYTSRVAEVTISRDDDGRVFAELRPKDLAAELGETAQRTELVGLSETTLIAVEGQQGLHIPYAFVGDDGAGHARYLHIGRAMPRSSD